MLGAVVVAIGAVVVAAGLWILRRGESENGFTKPPSPICRTRPTNAANVRTDCEYSRLRRGTAYSNETSIAVNPTRPSNVLAAADDSQILTTGRTSELHYKFPRVRTSDDGGRTWTSYPVDWHDMDAIDVQVAFDGSGTAYLSAIANEEETNPGVYVAHSGDGGRRWSDPVRVAAGSGTEVEGIENDKVALAAWGRGNAVVAWTQYHLRRGYAGSPIMASVTHDGGRHWTPPVNVSAAAPFCVGFSGDHACDQAQNPQPVVTADGHVLVSLMASPKAGVATAIEPNTLMVVELDPSNGTVVAGPFRVAPLADASSAYPVSDYLGLPTLHHSLFVASSLGTIAAEGTNPDHLAEVWSDMRNSPPEPPRDPYAATTNADIVVAQSLDRGRTWSPPTVLGRPGDQFQPWATFDTAGRLRVGFLDRSYDPANERYGYTLATESQPGSLRFEYRQATTALSNPTRDDHLLAVETVNEAFPHPTRHIGDYTGLATTPTGVIAYWTDLRDNVCFGGRCAAGQATYVANLP